MSVGLLITHTISYTVVLLCLFIISNRLSCYHMTHCYHYCVILLITWYKMMICMIKFKNSILINLIWLKYNKKKRKRLHNKVVLDNLPCRWWVVQRSNWKRQEIMSNILNLLIISNKGYGCKWTWLTVQFTLRHVKWSNISFITVLPFSHSI